MTTIYGIHNCDTVKKALKWLENENIDYTFHDLRKDGLSQDQLNKFFDAANIELLINKRSTTYRSLDESIKNDLTQASVNNSVLEQPTLLKRPLLVINDQLHLGFKPAQYQEIFSS
ncbi:ArsC family reductase [Thalassotalea crassostreae]|uniref:ArsC family reductase n=1 Tax=Thalassotalea crassostreae TaxID=1763536 RepID=UPI000838D788|nr:ArsC family reductase [Thalassotalea crassostreae]